MEVRRCLISVLLVATLFLASSCIKNDVLENVVMDQAFSLPLGEKELQASTPTPGVTKVDNSSSYFFLGKPYTIKPQYLQDELTIDFKMDSISKIDWIQRLDLKVRFTNMYPVGSRLQIYLLNSSKQVTDSVFTSEVVCEAGVLDRFTKEVKDSTVSIPNDVVFEGDRLTRLKQTKFLAYKFTLESARSDTANMYFNRNSKIKVNVAMRLFLKYKLEDL